jgi:hypothetical protein
VYESHGTFKPGNDGNETRSVFRYMKNRIRFHLRGRAGSEPESFSHVKQNGGLIQDFNRRRTKIMSQWL